MPIFDTHAHYDADRFDSDRDELLSAMPGVGVGLVLDPGCDLPSSHAAAERLCLLAQLLRRLGQHGEHRDLLKGGAVHICLQSCFQGGQRQLVHPQGAGQRVTLQKVDTAPLAHDDPRLGTTQQLVPGEG